MIELAEIVAFLWASAWAVYALRLLARGSRSSVLFAYLVFFGLFVIPVAADLIYGMPAYTERGFYVAAKDPLVRILYCIYLAFIPPLWLRKQFVKGNIRAAQPLRLSKSAKGILLVGAALPAVLLLFAPMPHIYMHYGFVASKDVPLDILWFHNILAAVTILSILSGAAFLACFAQIRRGFGLVLPLFAIAIFLNGKRAIFALAVISIVLVLWARGALRGRRFFLALCASAFAIGLFSSIYESTIRDISAESTSPEYAYKNTRIDYGRDSRVKMALYAELHAREMRILDYPGESLLFDITFWVPRSVWAGKPYPYAVYFTSALLGTKVGMLGWGMTTSLLDEAIANFGWAGIIFGPLAVLAICNLGDSCKDQKISILTVVVAALLLSVHLAAFLPLFWGWVFLVIRGRRKSRRCKRLVVTITQKILPDGTNSWVLARVRTT